MIPQIIKGKMVINNVNWRNKSGNYIPGEINSLHVYNPLITDHSQWKNKKPHMFSLNCFRPYFKDAIQEKLFLFFNVFHYFFFFLILHQNSLSEFLRAEGGKQIHFKAEADEDYIEKKRSINLSICIWIVLIIIILWGKKLKLKSKRIKVIQKKKEVPFMC